MSQPIFRTIVFGMIAGATLTGAAQSEELIGTRVVVTNTFQGEMTKNIETDPALMGMPFANNIFTTIANTVELPKFLTIYDIDISASAVNFTWVESKFSKGLEGSTPAKSHDRNYFIFDMAEGLEIKTFEFDAHNSQLLKGSAKPIALRISGNKVVTDFGEGVIRGLGFNPAFTITVGPVG